MNIRRSCRCWSIVFHPALLLANACRLDVNQIDAAFPDAMRGSFRSQAYTLARFATYRICLTHATWIHNQYEWSGNRVHGQPLPKLMGMPAKSVIWKGATVCVRTLRFILHVRQRLAVIALIHVYGSSRALRSCLLYHFRS
jgi:hypothetical protein